MPRITGKRKQGQANIKNFNVVVLEDNEDDILIFKELLSHLDAQSFPGTPQCVYIDSLEAGLQYIDTHPVDLILLDLFLPDSNGLNTLATLKERVPGIPVIILTALDDRSADIEAVQMGAQEYLVKNDISPGLLIKAIQYALQRHQLHLQLENETSEVEQREIQLTRIINNDPDGIVIVSMEQDEHVLFVNPAAEKILGRTSSQLLDQPFGFSVSVDDSLEIAVLQELGEGHKRNVYVDMRAVNIEWKGEKAWLISLRDITVKKGLLQAYEEEKQRLEVTLRSIADGVIATDENGLIVMVNWMVCQMMGWNREEIVTQPLDDVLIIKNAANGETFQQRFCQATPMDGVQQSNRADNWILVSRKGEEIPIEFSCAPIRQNNRVMGTVLVIRDVTDKNAMEEEAARVQNLEALGLLAGGIAHEYNNILTTVIGYLSLARHLAHDNPKLEERLKKAEEAGTRAKEISGRLLTFSKGGEPRKINASLIKTLNEAAIDTINDPAVTVGWELEQLWPVFFDPDQVHLAMKNLLKNALEAMTEGGTIRIKAENIPMTNEKIRDKTILGTGADENGSLPRLNKGRYVRISISDQGSGIKENDLKRVFTPYFTTKRNADGMGLTTAYSIIRKHGGTITIKSRPGEGCTVMVWLPVMASISDNIETRLSRQSTASGPGLATRPGSDSEKNRAVIETGLRPRVLVMDDEMFIREIMRDMLAELGYDFDSAENGDEAIRLYQDSLRAGIPFDIVILDLTIPSGMGGKECMEILKEISPAIKAIVSSGYSNDPVIANYRDYGFSSVLPKPFDINDLKIVLNRLMAESKPQDQ